jgi:hypothetical protein
MQRRLSFNAFLVQHQIPRDACLYATPIFIQRQIQAKPMFISNAYATPLYRRQWTTATTAC